MERALQKMASQLNQYDAASLSSMWERYAHLVSRFEPTKRWEEAALVLCLIQAMHWKNQLFNSRLITEQQRATQDKNAAREIREKLHSYLPEALFKNKRPLAEGAQDKGEGSQNKGEGAQDKAGGTQGKGGSTQSRAGGAQNPAVVSGAQTLTGKDSGSSRESKQRRKVLVFKLRDHGQS